ncbi:tetratricopeptide repeat protein [Litoreibacter ascidiaceicola]|uniref:tetratricopeptide repeat protein n=1 Tax=Litoreibacter ascidiaceicola TaxID=1486859 RepID=UPI0015879FD6|nr:SPOR domain-containing protein [Litoreibacter ascidiaceicola]
MKNFFLLLFLTSIFTTESSSQVLCPVSDKEDLDQNFNSWSSTRSPATINEYFESEIEASEDDSFCLRYSYGRHLVRQSLYLEAQKELLVSIKLATNKELTGVSPHNVLGFTYLAEKNFDAAIVEFKKAKDFADFDLRKSSLKVKILNNLGYTLMQLGRYNEAREYLFDAQTLGSSKASRNLAALDSLVSTLESSDPNEPGAFAAVIASAASRSSAVKLTKKLDTQTGFDHEPLSVFRMKNGVFSVTVGSYRSYSAATSDLEPFLNEGFSDAYVGWLAEWEQIDFSE